MGIWRWPERERTQLANLFLHDWSEKMEMTRRFMAKSKDLAQDTVSKFPGSTTILNYSNGWGKALAASVLVGAAGLGAWKAGVFSAVAPAPAPAPAVTTEDRAAKIQLFYDDPEKGLIPLSGAAGEGSTIQP